MEYRPVPDVHGDAARRLVAYAFRPASGPEFAFDDADADPSPDAYDARGVYDVPDGGEATADDLAAACRIYRFDLRVRGTWTAAGGLSAVASDPAGRRRGHVGALLDGFHRELHADGATVSTLWPFSYGFYRRFGYEQVSTGARVTLPPDELSTIPSEPAGTFERLTADDWAAAADVYRAWATESLAMARDESWWRTRVFDSWDAAPYVYGWRDDDLRGYVVYTFEEGDAGSDDRTMVVRELAAADDRARGHCLRFCRDHDSQVGSIRLSTTPGDARRLQAAAADPYAVDVEIRPGPMARVVDLPAAIDALAVPAAAEADLTVAVADHACPWNDGRYRLTAADGSATLDRLGDRADDGRERAGDGDPRRAPAAAGGDATADVRASIGALSAALVGATPIDELARRGGFAGDDDALTALAGCLPAVDVFLREGF
jgi:predicted acetyltransferase